MRKLFLFASLMMVTFCLCGCGTKQTSEPNNSNVKKQMSIEEMMYQQHGNYAVFKSDYSYNNQKIWIVFLRNEEMAVFINSNNLREKAQRGLRYNYEIRNTKLRLYNGYEKTRLGAPHHYPETSTEIFLTGDGRVAFNMKQYGNRRDVQISAVLSDVTLSDGCLNFVKQYARE